MAVCPSVCPLGHLGTSLSVMHPYVCLYSHLVQQLSAYTFGSVGTMLAPHPIALHTVFGTKGMPQYVYDHQQLQGWGLGCIN